MLKFTENFSMTFAENRTYGVPEFAGTEVNRHSSKLKGLSGGQGKKGLHHNMENTLGTYMVLTCHSLSIEVAQNHSSTSV